MDPKANYKEETERNFLLMSIAYAANIGGKMFLFQLSRVKPEIK